MLIEFSKAVAFLLALCFIQSFISRRWADGRTIGLILSGILFGGICVIGMIMPIEVSPGVIFDPRSVVISIAGLFGGPVVGGIAAAIAGGYRLWIGGGGAIVGIAVVASSLLLGLAYRYGIQRGWLRIGVWQLLAFGLIVNAFQIYFFTFLPKDVIAEVMGSVALPLILIFTPATALLGGLLHLIDDQIKTTKSLLESEK
jgi:LytS/YehU family sensor histidine kinase